MFIETKVKGSKGATVKVEAPQTQVKAPGVVFVKELAEYNGANLQTREYKVLAVKVGTRNGIICGYCFAPWNRSKLDTSAKQRIPQRECSKCKVLLCGHLARYCGAKVGSRCEAHYVAPSLD